MTAILNSLFGNWKTTLVGALAAVAAYLGSQGSPGWQIAGALLLALLGALSKDSNVTGGTVQQ